MSKHYNLDNETFIYACIHLLHQLVQDVVYEQYLDKLPHVSLYLDMKALKELLKFHLYVLVLLNF